MVHWKLRCTESVSLVGPMLPLETTLTGIYSASVARALIFSQISQQRDTAKVLKVLAATLSSVHISHVVFTMYSPRQEFDCSMTATGQVET